MAIPKYIIEEIKHSVRVSEVLGQYISIKRAGKEFHALCPFHKEKTPSFTINDDKGFYHCFGCGAHGDAISFLMNHDQMNYVEAIKHLADQVGIEVPEEKPEDIEKQSYTETLHEVMNEAMSWYQQQLHAEIGWAAREYITSRGLKPEIVERFKLGFAPKDRTGLKQHLAAKGYSEKQMFDVGLLTKPDDGASYDKFRSRLMFPIINNSGKCIAFGGRLISDDPNSRAPKYLNSPETELFHKRRQFYTVPSWGTQARPGGRASHEHAEHRPMASSGELAGGKTNVFTKARNTGRLLVVEGYMDVIACVQAGFEEVVATLGTAFTEEHATLLWRAVDEPVLCLDGDNAGSRAMLRAAELAMPLLTAGKNLRFMMMPAGDDPDTMLAREGKAAFDRLVTQAIPLHDAMFNAYAAGVDMTDPIKRAGLEKQLEQVAGQISDPSVKQHMRRYFKDKMWQGRRKESKKAAPAKPAMAAANNPLEKLNQAILKLLMAYPQLVEYAVAEELLTRMHSEDERLEDLKSVLQQYAHEEQHSPETLSQLVEAAQLVEVAGKLARDRSMIIPSLDLHDKQACQNTLKQWLGQLDRMNIENEYQQLTKTVHSGEASQEALDRMMALQQEIQAKKSAH